VGELAGDDSVLFLWTTWPFIQDALSVVDAWGFQFVTGLPWVKVDSREQLAYGVGYWFRGCTEPILVGKRKRAYRSNLSGIITQELGHSRKPEHIHELVERGGFPAPYLELFARQERLNWTTVGNECPSSKGEDIRDSIARLHRQLRAA
jgi:site-specific DNA-methyltransferase (adenine-specific)